MEIIINAKKMELTEALKDYVNNRFLRINKFNENFISAEVHLESEKHEQRVTASLRGRKSFFSEAVETENMYKAIDMCVDKLEKQIRRDKTDYKHVPLSPDK